MPKPGENTVANLLRTYRKARNLSQDRTAARAGIARKILIAIEKEQRVPALDELQRICVALSLEDDEHKALIDAISGYLYAQRPSSAIGRKPIDPDLRDVFVLSTDRATNSDLSLLIDTAAQFDIPVPVLMKDVEGAGRKWRGRRGTATRINRERQTAKALGGDFLTELFASNYTPENLAMGNLARYAVTVDDSQVDTTIVSRADWLGLSIELGGDNEKCQLISAPPLTMPPSRKQMANFIAYAQATGIRIWEAPIYRLLDVAFNKSHLSASFSLDSFLHYGFTSGFLLQEELIEAAIATDYSSEKVLARRAEFLPLRQQMLADGASLIDFKNRICANGVTVLFAMARHSDFVFLIYRRSGQVAGTQWVLSPIPMGFHQPLIDLDAEVNLSSTIYREVYEELFGGDGAEKQARRVKPDWYFDECEALGWLRDHRHAYALDCTCFGINLLTGIGEFGILLSIWDTDFWSRYGSKLEASWEVLHGAGRTRFSSAEPKQLSMLMRASGWDPGGLIAVIEGLKRLRELDPERVKLPDIRLLIT